MRYAAALLITLLVANTMPAQRSFVQSSNTPPATLQEALQQLSDTAGIIFIGSADATTRHGQILETRWQVDEVIRGNIATGFITKAWVPPLDASLSKYPLHQRALILMHTPSSAGFATPVPDGILPLDENNLADLRWVAAHVVRAQALAGGGVTQVTALPTARASVQLGTATLTRMLQSWAR